MGPSSLQLDLGLTGRALSSGLAPIPALWLPENWGFQALCHGVPRVWCWDRQASFGEGGTTPEREQVFLWQEFFSDPTQWWDNKRPCKDSQLAGDATMRRPPGSVSTSVVQGAPYRFADKEDNMEVGMCKKLCTDGQVTEAVDALSKLAQQGCRIPNNLFYRVLKRCIAPKDLILGRRIHALAVQSGYDGDAFLATHLIGLYASHGRLEEAMQVFSRVSAPDVCNWAAIILAYARHGEPTQSIGLYRQMCQSHLMADNRVFVAVLKACASAGDLTAGKDIHADIVSSAGGQNIFVQTCLVDMYAKCGSVQDARRVFDRLVQKDVVTWTAMIAGYAQQGLCREALSLYSSMQQEGIIPPNTVTYVCLLHACAGVGFGALPQGKQIHAQVEQLGLQDNLAVGNCLVNMYAKCGSIENAQRVFDRLSHKDVVTWTAMIAGYAQQGMGEEALGIYNTMQQEGMTPPNSVTFVCLLQACATVTALPLGKQLHAQIEQQGLQADVVVGSSLVNMYAKCGSMVDSQQVFDSLPRREIGAWNALIAGYTHQGNSAAVFALIDRMRLEGVQPEGITFLRVLAVCSYVGLVDKGWKCFMGLSTDHGISPTIEHYTCMMDLLGRAGHLDEALQMGKSMPFQPDGAVWRTLLGACRKWGNVEVGRQAFEFAVGVDDRDAAAFVMMSNIYADAQMWEEVKQMQARRGDCGACKQPGQSWWTDRGGVVHEFVVGDKRQPESECLYAATGL